jgi:hypothetical protein
LSNIGLLVTTSGRVTSRSAGCFTIDDGSGVGVKCILPAETGLPDDWTYVAVTGASSCEKVRVNNHEELRRVLLPRSGLDIAKLR